MGVASGAIELGTLTPHPDAARRLRHALLTNGFDESAIAAPIAMRAAVGAAERVLPWHEISGDDEPLTGLLELFLFADPVPAARAAAALSPLSLEDALRAGFVVADGDAIRSPWEVMFHGDLILLGDHVSLMTEGNVDFISPITASGRTLAAHTVRAPAGQALDLGTGSGVQALLAARHSEAVVGVDLNPRCAPLATVNGYLNEIPGIAYATGDWFDALDPVDGYDLIVANLPFVVSPDVNFRFAHGGLPAVELSTKVVNGALERIGGDGFVQILLTWTRGAGEDRMAKARDLVEGAGFDALVLAHGYEEAAQYAAGQCTWIAGGDDERCRELTRKWLEFYRRTGVDAIEYGLVCLRPRNQGAPWFHRIDVPRTPPVPSGANVLRAFAGNDFLARLSGIEELLAGTYELVAGHRVTQSSTHDPAGYSHEETRIDLVPDVGYSAFLAAGPAAVILAIEPGETLRAGIERVCGQLGLDAAEQRVGVAMAMKTLLGMGFVVPRPEVQAVAGSVDIA